MYEATRDDLDARVLLVERSQEDARILLFYPDWEAQVAVATEAGPHCQMALSWRDFLVEKTGDRHGGRRRKPGPGAAVLRRAPSVMVAVSRNGGAPRARSSGHQAGRRTSGVPPPAGWLRITETTERG
jgi:hypothetical protein